MYLDTRSSKFPPSKQSFLLSEKIVLILTMAKQYTIKDLEKYSQALQKAINGQECPVKQKHVRSAIIGTFHTQSAKTFWAYALRLPIMEDRIVAWKLCHVVHKILREGHPLCIDDSQRHRKELDEIGKLWGHLKEGYGKMIRLYTLVLINKLEFHKRNPRFPGHLGVTTEELERIGGNDVNNFFDMAVEMFDYMDCILDLQHAVFNSLDPSRANSMTTAGQCRLSPLIPCIQDASKLYDYCVKMLFKMHAILPPDVLTGHRERFLKQFRALKKFYENTSNLQYFRDLIAIPPLPEKPPNFLIMGDFRTYITQEVVVPQELEQEDELPPEGSLIDTSEPDLLPQENHQSVFNINEEILQEREFLRSQCEKLRHEVNALLVKNEQEVNALQVKISNLETDLVTKESELVHERQVKEELLNQSFTVAQCQDTEQKIKTEKFDKLKALYVKLRDEHVLKIREKAEVDKKMTTILKDLEQLKELEIEKRKLQESEKQKCREIEILSKDKEIFYMETEVMKKSVRDACQESDSLQLQLQNILQEKEELKNTLEELTYKLLDLERQLEHQQREATSRLKTIVREVIESNEKIVRYALHEVDNPAITDLTCTPDYLRGVINHCLEALRHSSGISYIDYVIVITSANNVAHRIATFILQGRATCNSSPDITFGDKMAEACKALGEIVLKLFACLKENQNTEDIVKRAVLKLEEIAELANCINASLIGEKVENLADMLENEMVAMDKAIEEAAFQIQEMLTKSRAADSGIKLEVNGKILDTCTNLMQAIRILVQKSRLLQAEIISQGRGTASAKEFYKRNHQWTDGFISAAKSVAVAANFLLTAADKVVTSNGKLEQLIVASQEIAASTAQLVVASRVKADRNSTNLQQLTHASKDVTQATGTVVATVKDCSQLIVETEEIDVPNLTLHQAKKLEMESQVRVLELEKELEQERYRLAKLRRHHYQLAADTEL